MITIDDKLLKQNPLAEGGEGLIYEYNGTILKIYKDNVNKQEKLEKIKRLMSKSLPLSVIKPIDIAYNTKKQFIGYTMQKIEGEEFKRLSNKKFVKLNNITLKDIAKMLVDIKNTLIELHKNNIYVSDLNDCNILFDKNFNIYFIDADSWTIDDLKCTVCMDTFKDPLMKSNDFNNDTDAYAFAVLTFKTLTRIHPFGGTVSPDISILDRMKSRVSVIGNTSVTIPRTIDKWDFINPKLISEMKDIFEGSKRFIIDKTLNDFADNLKLCTSHDGFYYSKFNICPVCDSNAKVIQTPIKVASTGTIPFILLLSDIGIKAILSQNAYINNQDMVIHKDSKKQTQYVKGNRYYFSNDGSVLFVVSSKELIVKIEDKEYKFEKVYNSQVIVKDNAAYYLTPNNTLTELTINKIGNSAKSLAKVSFNSIFEVYDRNNYFICNIYDNMKIINVNGWNYTINDNSRIQNYGIHFDTVSKRWLFIIEDEKGNFLTHVFDKNNLVYKSDSIRYTNELGNLCFGNNIIFKAGDKAIKGFSYEKNAYKDFPCDIVNEDSKLLRDGSKFIVINEKEIYKVG